MAKIKTPEERKRAKQKRKMRRVFENGMSDEMVEQLRLTYIRMMVDPRYRLLDRDTFHKRFIKTFGIAPKHINKWVTDKRVQEDIRKLLREMYGGGERIKELYDLLWQRAHEGSVAAIKLGLELTGEYTPGLKIEKTKTVEDLLDSLEEEEGFKSDERSIRKELLQPTSGTRH